MEIKSRAMILQDGLGIASKPDAVGDLIVTITVKTQMSTPELAKLLHIQKQKVIKYFEIGSDQVEMDLFVAGVKSEEAMKALNKLIETGEVALEEHANVS